MNTIKVGVGGQGSFILYKPDYSRLKTKSIFIIKQKAKINEYPNEFWWIRFVTQMKREGSCGAVMEKENEKYLDLSRSNQEPLAFKSDIYCW